ncbi:MAG: helix-turn-helix domain-containing protein [Verrucomicrobiota bacterium]
MTNSSKSEKVQTEAASHSLPQQRPTATLSPETNRVLIGLLSRAEVAARLGVCVHSVQRMTRKGLLPCIVFNRRLLRYKSEDVEKFILSAVTGKGRAE